MREPVEDQVYWVERYPSPTPQIHVHPEPVNVNLLEHKVFADIITLR